MKTLFFEIALCALILTVASYAESARSLVYQAYDTPDDAAAIQLFSQALEVNADFIYAYVGRGLRKQQQGDLDGAIEDFNEAIERNHLFLDAYICRAKAKQQKGDDAGYNTDMAVAEQMAQKADFAMIELDRTVEKYPQDAQVYLDRARYKKHKGQFKGAVEDYNQYLLCIGRPQNPLVIFERANAKKVTGDVEGALNDYSTAIRMFPDNATAYEKRATLRRQSGDIQGAIADMEVLRLLQHSRKVTQIEKLSRMIEDADAPSHLLLLRSELWLEMGDSTNALRDARQYLKVFPNDQCAKQLEKSALRTVKEHQAPKNDQ